MQNHTSSKDKLIGVAAIDDYLFNTCDVNIDELSDKLLKIISELIIKMQNLNTLSEQLLLKLGKDLACNIIKANYAEGLRIFRDKVHLQILYGE